MSSGLPTGALKPADLSPGHAGAGQILPATRKYPSLAAPKEVHCVVAKANYHQIRRQKELARKTRQQEKQQKRAVAKASDTPGVETDNAASVDESATHLPETAGSGDGS
jgi:hypothetical protein